MNSVLKAWETGIVKRWHTNTHLCHTIDYTCGHTGRMATMAVYLGWGSLALLEAIATHDRGEKFVGDFSYTFKRSYTQVADTIESIEVKETLAAGFPPSYLTKDETTKLKLLDSVDAVFWMRLHRPDLELRCDWKELVSHVSIGFLEVGVGDPLKTSSIDYDKGH